MEIDLDHRTLIDRLKKAVSLDRIGRHSLIDEVSGGEAVKEHLGFGLIERQLDDEIQVLGEPRVAVDTRPPRRR